MRYRPEQHLRRQGEIKAVRELGRRMDCGAFTLWWVERPEGARPTRLIGPRVCVVASIAAVGNAVHRTRAKRRLRELFRIHQQRIPDWMDVMLIAKGASARGDFKEIERRFLQACERLPKARRKPQPSEAKPVAESPKPAPFQQGEASQATP